jgi:CheY-like chemotaxis protein
VDGLGFIARLAQENLATNIPCVMLSSLGDRGDLPHSIGIAAWLGKPIRRSALLRILASVVGQNATGTEHARPASPRSMPFSGIAVLLAEDNVVNQKVAMHALKGLGLDVHLVVNGSEALEAVQERRFDAVLMDCQMPVMDGYAATAAIREWERANRHPPLPIIAMTANALDEDRERCLQLGMDDHIAKPFKRDELAKTLQRWLPTTEGVLESA